MAETDPGGFVRMIAGILPAKLDVTIEHELFAAASTFAEAFRIARQKRPSSMKPIETDTSDPFSQLETAGEILGFVFRQCTEAGLRQLFTLDEAKQFPRELLEDAAAELAQAGMLKASAIVADAAKDAPIRVESCPYQENTANARSWHRSQEWHRHKQTNYTQRPDRG
ncbi:MAG: hypothetical protein WCD25_27220 [Pseudolabrys sp.]